MTAALAGAFGLLVGSFLNVVIHRVPAGASIVRPGSACPRCGTEIAARDNVPVVSWLVLRGRCRACGAGISARYPLVELGTGVLFAGAALRFSRPADAAFAASAGAVLIALSVIDLDHRRVPNVIVLPSTAFFAVWVVVVGTLLGPRRGILDAAVGGAAGFALLFVIAVVSGGMGFGDVKLAALIGVVTGWFGLGVFVLGLFAGFVAGGLVAVVLLAAGRSGRKDAIPFAPMLCAGAMFALFVGDRPVRAWLGG